MSARANVTPIRAAKVMPEPVWLSPEQVCERIPGVTVVTLKEWRSSGHGPAFFKPTGQYGKVTWYAVADIDAWVAAGRMETRDRARGGVS